MKKVFAITVIINGYEQVIYITADNVKLTHMCSFNELDEAEQELFGNTELGNDFAVFEPESLA
jgi:hypothetical protein